MASGRDNPVSLLKINAAEMRQEKGGTTSSLLPTTTPGHQATKMILRL